MKNVFAIIAMFISVLFISCNGPIKGKNGVSYKTALQYNDYILNKQKDIVNLIMQYAQAGQNDLAKADVILDTAIATSNRYINDVEGMPAWKGDSTFRDTTLSLFRFYKNTFSGGYRYIIDMQRDGTVSAAEEEKYKQIVADITDTEGRLDANMKRTQQAFADKNGFRVERTELQDKINQMKGPQ